MKYYKIIYDNQIIGVVSSKNFIQYIPAADCFSRCNETKGEYVSYNGQLYRDSWMNPTTIDYNFIEARIISISQEEYNIYAEAIEQNEIIENDEPEDQPIDDVIIEPDPNDTLSIEFIRASKINAMSYKCKEAIESGIDINIRGENQHFSLTIQDQLNLMGLNILTQTQSLIPYHADGAEQMFYTADEIKEIITAANDLKNYHLTYYNSLKSYINTLNTIEEIAAVEYGIDIPEEYKTDVLKILET